jgi:hypothetical protein
MRASRGIQQDLSDFDVVYSIDQTQMGLGHHCKPVVLQTLDQIQLPERSRPIESPSEDASDELPKLVKRARTW